MSDTPISISQTLEARHDAKLIKSIQITSKDAPKSTIFMLLHNVTSKVALLVDSRTNLIEFDTPYGKKSWIDGWGILDKTSLLVIEDGLTQSLGIYGLDGSRSFLAFDSNYQTTEHVYRLLRTDIRPVGDNSFLLTPYVESLSGIASHGPE